MKKIEFSLRGNRCWINYMKQVIEDKKKNKKPEEKFLETKKLRRRTFRLPKVAVIDA